MLDITALAVYIVYMEHNPGLKSKNQRRFLKDFANQLCISANEIRSTIPRVVENHFTHSSTVMMLGRQRQAQTTLGAVARDQNSRDSFGSIPVAGSCSIC